MQPGPGRPKPPNLWGSHMVTFIRSDLDFILHQILIAEQTPLERSYGTFFPTSKCPLACGRWMDLSTIWLWTRAQFGAADNTFPRLTDAGVPRC